MKVKNKEELLLFPLPPDELRCRRTDGKRWRCNKLIGGNDTKGYCDDHYHYKCIPRSKRKSNKKAEGISSETDQSEKTILEDGEGGGGLEEESESLPAGFSNPSCGGDGGGLGKESESLPAGVWNPSSGGDGGGGKKRKKRFTQEQKDKMLELFERLGWRIRKQDEAVRKEFCDETGISLQSLEVWMKNTRDALAKVSSGGSLLKKTKYRYTQEQMDKMMEFGERLEEESESLPAGVSNPSCGGDGGLGKESESLPAGVSNPSCGGDGGGGSSKKKKKKRNKRFTQEQKDKMLELLERLGWKNRKQDEAVRKEFCNETGISPKSLKFWVTNTRHALAKASSRYTQEQMDKMMEFGERLGWRALKTDKTAVEQFCHEIGVKPLVFKFWVYNQRQKKLGYRYGEGRADSQSKIKEVETQNPCLEAEKERCSEESKFGETMKFRELSVELEKKKMECIAIQNKYQNGLKEWISCVEDQKFVSEREKLAQERITNLHITRLEEDKKVVCEREKRAQERITSLEEELGKTGRDEIEKYVLLKTDNRDLECTKRRAEDEIKVCKKRFCGLETVLRMEEEKVLNTNEQIRASALLGYGFREGGADSQIEKRKVETQRGLLEAKTKKSSEASKLGDLGETLKLEVELKKHLEVYETKCHELSVELERKKMECIAIQDKYEDGLKEWTSYLEDKKVIGKREKRAQERITNLRIDSLEEDKKVICEREKRAQERITCLEEELRKTGNEREKYVQLRTENRYLECGKRRAEDELEVWKKKFCELETRVLRMEEHSTCNGGFNLEGSDSLDSGGSFSDSEDVEDIHSAFNKELKWKFEADMLSSFDEDPELCMRAVCALYRQHTSEEKSVKSFLHYRNQGFNEFDALRGTTLAAFLMDGDCKGDLKKSVKELKMFDLKAFGDCKRLAILYSEQLFNIYQSKADPFFCPSSTGR